MRQESVVVEQWWDPGSEVVADFIASAGQNKQDGFRIDLLYSQQY